MPARLIRLPSLEIDTNKFNQALEVLQSASHNTEADYFSAPLVVSCVTAVRYILEQGTGGDFGEFSNQDFPNLPKKLKVRHNSQLVAIHEAHIGDLVFYYGPWFKNKLISCINHVGIVISETGSFYHSTQAEHFTVSNLEEKKERIAKEGQLS